MKNIIQRNLSLQVQYHLIDKNYIPLENGSGICCANCNKIIANIATVKDDNGKTYDIGFDCFETLLINNSLLSTNDIQDYEKAKKMLPKILKFSKVIKEVLDHNKSINITGLLFEKSMCFEKGIYFYWLQNNKTESRDNYYYKMKEVDLDFLMKILKNIFPKFDIIVK